MRVVGKLILSTLLFFLISLGEINLLFYLCNTNLNQKANEESNALMVVTPDAVVREYSQLFLIKSSSARMLVKDDYAQAQGYRDGKFVGGSYGKSGYLH